MLRPFVPVAFFYLAPRDKYCNNASERPFTPPKRRRNSIGDIYAAGENWRKKVVVKRVLHFLPLFAAASYIRPTTRVRSFLRLRQYRSIDLPQQLVLEAAT